MTTHFFSSSLLKSFSNEKLFKWIATPHDFLSKPKKNILHHQKNAFQKYAHFFFKTRVSVVNLSSLPKQNSMVYFKIDH